jgi:hypothetical protein
MEYDTRPINLLLTLYRLAVSTIKVAKEYVVEPATNSSRSLFFFNYPEEWGASSSSETSVRIFPINIVKKLYHAEI